jgi:hypothetical protein
MGLRREILLMPGALASGRGPTNADTAAATSARPSSRASRVSNSVWYMDTPWSHWVWCSSFQAPVNELSATVKAAQGLQLWGF